MGIPAHGLGTFQGRGAEFAEKRGVAKPKTGMKRSSTDYTDLHRFEYGRFGTDKMKPIRRWRR